MENITTIDELNKIIKHKTNKFIYFSNGTKMSKVEFNEILSRVREDRNIYLKTKTEELKNHINVEEVTLPLKDYKDSIYIKGKLEDFYKSNPGDLFYGCNGDNVMNHNGVFVEYDYETDSYIELKESPYLTTTQILDKVLDIVIASERTKDFLREDIERTRSRTKMIARDAAIRAYGKDFDDFKIRNTPDNGIKFIIQIKNDVFRMRFDPYGIVHNEHSEISDMFTDGWYTLNGGWMTINTENKTVILDRESGSYGKFKPDVAKKCAELIFNGKKLSTINKLYSYLFRIIGRRPYQYSIQTK